MNTETQVVLEKLTSPMFVALGHRMRQLQFPARCAGKTVLGIKDGGRFWGSMSNIWSERMLKLMTAKSPPIFAPAFVGWSVGNDKKYCSKHQGKNLWLCYFLPTTKCAIPAKTADIESKPAVSFFAPATNPSAKTGE
jgi:hypothetical protein